MSVIIRHEIEFDLRELSEQLSATDKWALLDMLMDDLAKEGTTEDWASFWEEYQGWPKRDPD
jgi:hypothetical protein